nr:MAG: hypothetical protein DIU78_24620 [Pseudomonadota bacterium]
MQMIGCLRACTCTSQGCTGGPDVGTISFDGALEDDGDTLVGTFDPPVLSADGPIRLKRQ